MKQGAMIRDLAQIMTDNQRPNTAFWKDPRAGRAEYAVNELLAGLVCEAEQARRQKTREQIFRDIDALIAATGAE